MALHFYYGDIEDWENVCFHPGEDGKMKTVTDGLIWSTISVGIDRITKNNWRDYFIRLYSIECVLGPYRHKLKNKIRVEIFYTPEEVKAHIGLSTNASSKNKREFSEFLRKQLAEKAELKLKAFDKKTKEVKPS